MGVDPSSSSSGAEVRARPVRRRPRRRHRAHRERLRPRHGPPLQPRGDAARGGRPRPARPPRASRRDAPRRRGPGDPHPGRRGHRRGRALPRRSHRPAPGPRRRVHRPDDGLRRSVGGGARVPDLPRGDRRRAARVEHERGPRTLAERLRPLVERAGRGELDGLERGARVSRARALARRGLWRRAPRSDGRAARRRGGRPPLQRLELWFHSPRHEEPPTPR